ncbi:Outer membrane lipoprotein omp19 [Nymphon striatum]|nr:Outer membrane lipoprotein omp19 [Nymphon striatum]
MWLQIQFMDRRKAKGSEMGNKTSIAILMMAIAVAGCSRSTNALNINTAPPQPLPSPLVWMQPTTPQAAGVDGAPLETASLETAPASTEPLTHEPLAGSWNVASDSSQCRAILAFTKWSGGYRATTLRCNSPELSTVTAWDIKGSKVVLVDTNGSQVASLGSVGTERYAGTTASAYEKLIASGQIELDPNQMNLVGLLDDLLASLEKKAPFQKIQLIGVVIQQKSP